MNRTEKQELVDKLARDFQSHPTALAVDFRGLKVEEANTLRRRVRESGSQYFVVKNTLALRAIAGTPLAALADCLTGMTGLAYTKADPVALAKVLTSFAKDVPALTFKGGVVSGSFLGPEKVAQLASLPGREEMLARFLSVLQAPIQNLLGVLNAPARDLVLVLKAAEGKKGREA